jgi:hypothetical protein
MHVWCIHAQRLNHSEPAEVASGQVAWVSRIRLLEQLTGSVLAELRCIVAFSATRDGNETANEYSRHTNRRFAALITFFI